jgi:hypothetical protein
VNFNSHADAVVQVAVRLVNTLTEGEMRGRPYLLPAQGQTRCAAVTDVLRTGSRRAREVTVGE